MKTVNQNLLLIAIQILSLDKPNRATIEYEWSEQRSDGTAKKWHKLTLKNIYATGRVFNKINDPGELGYEKSKRYVSQNNSRSLEENPFCLMRKHMIDEEGKSAVSYYLKCVEENGSYTIPGTMPDGTPSVERVWKKNRPNYMFKRWVDSYAAQKAYHDKSVAEAHAEVDVANA